MAEISVHVGHDLVGAIAMRFPSAWRARLFGSNGRLLGDNYLTQFAAEKAVREAVALSRKHTSRVFPGRATTPPHPR
jgi:hypothetical protein